METASILACIAFTASFFSAGGFSWWAVNVMERKRVARNARGDADIRFMAVPLRNGIRAFKPCSLVLLRNARVQTFIKETQSFLESRAYTTSLLSLCSVYCLLVAGIFFLGVFVGGHLFLGVLFAAGSLVANVAFINHWKDGRREAAREAVPDALRSMSACSFAGFSLKQTFKQVSTEVSEPLRSLFLRAVHTIDVGKTVNEALEEFRAASNIPELAFVAVALDVQHRTGGSLQQVIDSARDSVESELELRRTLKVQTAQAKLSARIVSVMPFLLVGVFSLISPGFLDPFFRSIEGFGLLGLAAVMQLAGILLVRQLLRKAVD